jgi:hypothetical protein
MRGGRDLFAQRLRLRSRRQRLCLPRRQRAEEIQPRVLQGAPRADEGRHCDALHVKPKCCPNMPARKIARSVNEAARDKARAIVKTKAYVVSRRQRKKVEMLFAISGAPARTERSERRVPSGSRPQSEEAGEVDPFPSTIFATERRHPKGVVAPTRAQSAEGLVRIEARVFSDRSTPVFVPSPGARLNAIHAPTPAPKREAAIPAASSRRPIPVNRPDGARLGASGGRRPRS